MPRRKIKILVTTVALIGLAMVGGTLAWFTDRASVDNKMVMGYIDIKIEEPEYVESDYQAMLPGDPILKDPTVFLEASSQPAYIRVKAPTVAVGKEKYPLFQKDKSSDFHVVLADDWVWQGEYLYYTKVLGGENAAFAALLKKQEDGESYTMRIPEKWTNSFTASTLNLTFFVEAIQAKNIKPNFENEDPWTVSNPEEILAYKGVSPEEFYGK